MDKPLSTEEIRPDGQGFLPGLAIDCVIFGFHDNQLKILLLEYRHTDLFALPGGFIRSGENLNDAAKRTLNDRTSLRDIYLDQFYVFGDMSRYDPNPLRTILLKRGLDPVNDHWLLQRFVTVGFYALVDFTKAIPIPDLLSDNCQWHDLATLPPLMLDHNLIVAKALDTLRADLDRKLIVFNLLPETFTMNDLQSLYETILGQPLHRSSFQRKMLGLGILERLKKQYSGGAHKAPYLYRFVHNAPKTQDSLL
ncbi:NUDIX domain-containing protein [Spirosoma terrae]|uniref:NUDIX hydrolase n=1 Tax=Spirosoma terrae TaxID=1968276 RepID=A0A6L9LJL5_9BACT|nr:NUDIX domain-containing protein [Spirosoma terrae]NDU98928.1 NUDIX hydrolase [Spirosoma terrae]